MLESNMRIIKDTKLNNKGLSLLELIIAVSIGVIVSGAVTALISFAIRTYRDQNANLNTQYELQTNANQIMDTIMSAECYVIKSVPKPVSPATYDPPGRFTEYAAFGKYNATDNKFTGVVFVAGPEYPADSDRFNIYMDSGTWDGDDAEKAVSTHVGIITASIPTPTPPATPTPNRYLLGEGATVFRIEPKIQKEEGGTKIYVNISSSSERTYVNPLSVEVEMNFQRDATGRKIDKHIKDEALLRNRISTSIYIDGLEYKTK